MHGGAGMKKALIVLAIMLLAIAPFVFAPSHPESVAVDAENNGKNHVIKPIRLIQLHGNGVAIDALDPMNFMHARIIIGGARILKDRNCIRIWDETSEEYQRCFGETRLGILRLDSKTYRLRNVTVSYDLISADIYDPAIASVPSADAAANHVGSIVVERFEKPETDIWAGEMELNGMLYNTYFLSVKRKFSTIEIREQMGDYCRRHPTEAACRYLNLCRNNPENPNCNTIVENLCVKNAGDVRCREFLRKNCKDNPNAAYCRKTTVSGEAIVTVNPETVSVEEQATVETQQESTGTNTEISQKAILRITRKMPFAKRTAGTTDENLETRGG